LPDHCTPPTRTGANAPTSVTVDDVRHGGIGDIWARDGYGESRLGCQVGQQIMPTLLREPCALGLGPTHLGSAGSLAGW
jgi:hypothetical protein